MAKDIARVNGTEGNGRTTYDFPTVAGMDLVGFELPTLTSTTIAISMWFGAAASASKPATDTAGAQLTTGGTTTGDEVVPMPDAAYKLQSGMSGVRLTLSAQASARVIVGLYESRS